VKALLSSSWRDCQLGIIKFVTIHSFDVHGLISLTIVPEEMQRDIIIVLLLLSRFLVPNMIRLHTIIYGVCAVPNGTKRPRFALHSFCVVNRFSSRLWTLYPLPGRTTAVLFTATCHAMTLEWTLFYIWLLLRFQFRLEIRESAICSILLTWLLLSWWWLARLLPSLSNLARTTESGLFVWLLLTLSGLDVWDLGLLGFDLLDSVQFSATFRCLRTLIAAAAFNRILQTLRLPLCCTISNWWFALLSFSSFDLNNLFGSGFVASHFLMFYHVRIIVIPGCCLHFWFPVLLVFILLNYVRIL
jgi:hypothetical protein